MKKSFILLFAVAVTTSSVAQQYISVVGTPANAYDTNASVSQVEELIPADQVEKITYEADSLFDTYLLNGKIAANASTTLFSKALKLTALADTLMKYDRRFLDGTERSYYRYKINVDNEVAWYDMERFYDYTVFVEPDIVFAAAGITNIDQLKAYAKNIYDAVYPEDAQVSDPKDRRNSLNRFVAYHILRYPMRLNQLTAEDGNTLANNFNRNLADISAYHTTLMGAVFKVSAPQISGKGLFLNRRGVKNNADKYGKKVPGIKIVNGSSVEALNGYYHLIDGILTYDQQTIDNVLGDERWRVDIKLLSPDFMIHADELRGNYMITEDPNNPDPYSPYGRNIAYKWGTLENITANDADDRYNTSPLVHRRAHKVFWCYEGDEIDLLGLSDFTIRLPLLPAGQWEVRLGYCGGVGAHPDVALYLNDKLTIERLHMSYHYSQNREKALTDASAPKVLPGPKEYGCGLYSYSIYWFNEIDNLCRAVVGRIVSDGKSNCTLRLRVHEPETQGNLQELMLDYLEFCPVSIADNQEIPED